MSTQTNQAQSEIRQNIVEMFEIDKLPVEKQEETIDRIGKIIFQAVLLRVLPEMTEEDVNEYEKLIENKVAPDDLMYFFFQKVPNFLQIVAEESENFRIESAKILAEIK